MFELYGRGAYEEALALIEEKWEAFPDFESDLFFWRACLAGRLGDGAGAIDALRQAAERGHWYHERMLRDPDLDLIRSSEELAELQRLFQEGTSGRRRRHDRGEKFRSRTEACKGCWWHCTAWAAAF